MPNLVYLNSKYIPFKDAKIPIEDRGFQFSDSVYEVVKIINKKIIDFDFHMRRLKFSTAELKFNFKVNSKLLKKIFENLIIKNKISNGIIYFQITRGVQSREHAYRKNLKPNVIIYTAKKKFNLPNKNYKGFKAITYTEIRWGKPDIKTTSLLANIIASTKAKKNGAYESILVKKKKLQKLLIRTFGLLKEKK